MRHVATRALVPSLALCCGFGCSNAPVESAPTPPGPPEWNRSVTPPADDDARAARSACAYRAGSLPAETQGASYPNGADVPIDHIIVVVMENRSFDHYFQKLPEYGQPDADVAPPGFSNPDANGAAVPIFHQPAYCFVDTAHGWRPTHEEVNSGAMNGFVTANDGASAPPGADPALAAGARALGYYDASDLPFYYALASEFAIADRYFCSLQGPTSPNRSYLYGGSSYGIIDGLPPPDATTIVDYLEARQIDWRVYKSPKGAPGIATFVGAFLKYWGTHGRLHADFFADAAAGTLPSFAFVDPSIGIETGQWDNDDEHPPSDMQLGQRFVATVVDALAKSPAWGRSALFITYDEHGGLFDHVVPPPACPPDDLLPPPGADPQERYDELGVRVPLIVVSPYARRHFVSHEVYDHTSLLRFVEARFVLPALTNRDANALAPWDMFDFASPPHAPPSVILPPVDPGPLAACEAAFGN